MHLMFESIAPPCLHGLPKMYDQEPYQIQIWRFVVI